MESSVNLETYLPVELRGATTTIMRIAAGLSGAGVYRVEAFGQSFVLKVSPDDEPIAEWRRRLEIQELAANAGLAAPVIHADEAQRAIVNGFVVDRGFPALLGNPSTRETALVQLGRTLRRVHELPLPPHASAQDPRELLTRIWSGLVGLFAMPAFVEAAVEGVRTAEPPPRERALVLSHNDVNPSNLVYDGERILLLDWNTAGPNDPFYDLATISVFLRLDEETCRRLLAAYDGEPVSSLSARFGYNRRLVAVLCGTLFLHRARVGGHAGARGADTIESTLSLVDIYQKMRSGTLNVASADGQWAFGLALVKASVAL